MAGAAGDTGTGGAACAPDDLWRSASRFAVVDPVGFGALPDATTDATPALEAAVAALPATGGIVRFSAGTYWKQEKLWRIQKDHVLLWAPDGRATLHGSVRSNTQAERDDPDFCGPREQATIFERTRGGRNTARARVRCASGAPSEVRSAARHCSARRNKRPM